MAQSDKLKSLLQQAVESEFKEKDDVGVLTETEKKLWSVFEERPVTLNEFIQGDKYLDMGSTFELSEIQYDLVRHMEQIYFKDTYELMERAWGEYWKPGRQVNNIVAAWGKGSGKNQTIVIAFARITYLLMCLKSPQEYFGLAPNSFIHMMNVALSAPQAHRAFFKPMRELFISAPWFESKFAEDTLPGPQATFIRLKKRIELISGHSQADSQEGNNLICAVADEIAGFPTVPTSGSEKAPMRTADGILKMLKTSALTRFPVTYKLAQISFSRYIGDPIMSALAEAEKDIEEMGEDSTYYASGPHRTWDVHPKYRKGFEFVQIPQTDKPVPNVPDILADYRKRPAFSRGYYECRPEASENAFFKDKEKVKESFSRKVSVPPLKVNYYFGTDGEEKYPSWQVDFDFGPQLIPVPGAVYAIHADMALKDDRAGIAMCHVSHYEEIETATSDGSERIEMRPVVKVDFVTAFEYDAAAEDTEGNSVPREIQVRWYRKLVLALSDLGFDFASVSQDGWQSLDSLQILQSWGYEAHKVSTDVVSTPCWNTLRDLMYDGRLDGYEHKLLVNELLSLEKTNKGKIDHPSNGSKDLSDAVAASATMAVECGGEEEIGENTSNGFGKFADVDAFGIPTSPSYVLTGGRDSGLDAFSSDFGDDFSSWVSGSDREIW